MRWMLERALMDRPEGSDMQKSKSDTSKSVARIYYFRAFFYLALTYFRINNSQVRLLSQIILTSCVQHRSK